MGSYFAHELVEFGAINYHFADETMKIGAINGKLSLVSMGRHQIPLRGYDFIEFDTMDSNFS